MKIFNRIKDKIKEVIDDNYVTSDTWIGFFYVKGCIQI